jgi:hypothetical protein
MTELFPKNRLVQYTDPGVIIDPNPSQGSVIVSTTSVSVRPVNDQRSGIIIQNPLASTVSAYISVDGFPAVADATRIELAPGSLLSITAPEPGTNLAIYAITASGSVTLHYTEFS